MEGDDDSRTQTVFHNCVQSAHVVVILCARANPPLHLFEGGGSIYCVQDDFHDSLSHALHE